jgi:transposase
MRTGRPVAKIKLSAEVAGMLGGYTQRRKTAQALALRALIMLGCASGLSNKVVAARERVTAQTVGKWLRRFIEHGLDGLLDEPRPGVPRKIDDTKVESVIVQTLESQPAAATHWSTRSMARHSGISTSSVGRIWRAFGLQPHRLETFKLSSDPLFVDKVRDIVGLYFKRCGVSGGSHRLPRRRDQSECRCCGTAPTAAIGNQTVEGVEMHPTAIGEVEAWPWADRSATAGALRRWYAFAMQPMPAVLHLAPRQPPGLGWRMEHSPVLDRLGIPGAPVRGRVERRQHFGLVGQQQLGHRLRAARAADHQLAALGSDREPDVVRLPKQRQPVHVAFSSSVAVSARTFSTAGALRSVTTSQAGAILGFSSI